VAHLELNLISSLKRKERAGIEELSNYLISGFSQISYFSEIERLENYLISGLVRELMMRELVIVYNKEKT
jgi:hypothetical protein